jgi:hypothetical protein
MRSSSGLLTGVGGAGRTGGVSTLGTIGGHAYPGVSDTVALAAEIIFNSATGDVDEASRLAEIVF